MRKLQSNKRQKGFTIIELVVVILLLGILTATALPRFIDVTDDAHTAVVSAVVGGLGTGTAMFKAQWYADNQPGTVVDFNSMRANTSGFPLGLKAGGTTTLLTSVGTSANCQEVFQNLLQAGGQPSVAVLAENGTGISLLEGASALPTTSDFVAYLENTNTVTKNTCYYIYTGQYTNITNYALPYIQYDATTGAVTQGSI